jgi:hypothetical protein
MIKRTRLNQVNCFRRAYRKLEAFYVLRCPAANVRCPPAPQKFDPKATSVEPMYQSYDSDTLSRLTTKGGFPAPIPRSNMLELAKEKHWLCVVSSRSKGFRTVFVPSNTVAELHRGGISMPCIVTASRHHTTLLSRLIPSNKVQSARALVLCAYTDHGDEHVERERRRHQSVGG